MVAGRISELTQLKRGRGACDQSGYCGPIEGAQRTYIYASTEHCAEQLSTKCASQLAAVRSRRGSPRSERVPKHGFHCCYGCPSRPATFFPPNSLPLDSPCRQPRLFGSFFHTIAQISGHGVRSLLKRTKASSKLHSCAGPIPSRHHANKQRELRGETPRG